MLTHTSYSSWASFWQGHDRNMLVLRKITLPMMKIEECKFQV